MTIEGLERITVVNSVKQSNHSRINRRAKSSRQKSYLKRSWESISALNSMSFINHNSKVHTHSISLLAMGCQKL